MRFTFGRVEDLLVEQGRVRPDDLPAVKARESETRASLPQVLEEMGLLPKDDFWEIVSERMGVPYTPLTPDMIRPEAVEMLDPLQARRYGVIPVMKIASILSVAMVDPQDVHLVDQVKTACGCPVNPILCSEEDIRACLDHYHGRGLRLYSEPARRGEERPEHEFRYVENIQGGLEVSEEDVRSDDFSVARLVDLMISEAYNLRASDIHIEGARDFIRIRYRVDGELREAHRWPKGLQAPVVSRLKVLSNLDITRQMTPQDGHFALDLGTMEVDFRVATTPTERGENCVIRLLDQSRGRIRLEDVGFHETDLARVQNALTFSQGFVLMTGPTGSGKTTTLYAMLNHINSVEKKIITIEDPVEYRLDLINQIPVNPRTGLTFATGLRSVLRQDPDVVLVGEIRDRETAQIAVQASLTGHLLLSTLHTNGTVETIFRLMDIGIEAYFIKEVINCVVAQRLVKTLCPYCKEAAEPEPALLRDLGLGPGALDGRRVMRPMGCHFCGRSGYRGRTAVMEVLLGTDALKQGIMDGLDATGLREVAMRAGLRPFMENALEKAYAGVTSLEEVRRVMPPVYAREA